MGKIISVDFRGDQLFGFETGDGIFVALRPIVEAIGLSWGSQYNRVHRDPILRESVFMMKTPFGHGGTQDCVCMALNRVNGWLFTIDSSRIKDDAVRARVLMYQRECYDVLASHFLGKSVPEKNSEEETLGPSAARVRLVTETRKSFGCKQAQELWFKLGLPVVPSMLETPAQGDLYRDGPLKIIEHEKR